MNIKLIAIGKTDNKSLQTLIDDYTKRLSFYIKFELEIIPDIKNVKNLSESQQKEKEGELILSKLSATDQLILLDENGKTFSSVGFSEELQKKMNSGVKTLVFVIGGPYGFSETVYKKAQGKVSAADSPGVCETIQPAQRNTNGYRYQCHAAERGHESVGKRFY